MRLVDQWDDVDWTTAVEQHLGEELALLREMALLISRTLSCL